MTTEPTIGTVAFTRFKSLVNQTVELRPLTVLTGENSAGKSSVIQALRLLAQASRSSASVGSQDLFPFSGAEFNAGTWDELISDNHSEAGGAQTIGLALTVNEPQERRGGTAIWGVELSDGEVTQGAQLERVELGYFRGERSDLIQLRKRGDGSSSLSRDRADEDAWWRSTLFEHAIGNMRLQGPRRLSRRLLGAPPRFMARAYSNAKRISAEGPWAAAETQSETRPTLWVEPSNREPFTLQAEITFADTQTGLDPRLFVAADGSEELVLAWLSLFHRLVTSRRAQEQPTPLGAAATGTFEIPERPELPDNFLAAVADGFQAWRSRLGTAEDLSLTDGDLLPDIQDGDLEPSVATALESVLFLNADMERRIRHGLGPRQASFSPSISSERFRAARRSDAREPVSEVASMLDDQGVFDYLHSTVRDQPESQLVFELDEHGRDSRFFIRQIERSSNLVASVLANQVHYLGPLRTASSLYSSTVPVGLVATLGASGEYTAAILDRYQDAIVVCPLPTGGIGETSLLEAVGLWLSEFGVAAGAETTHHGKAGVRVRFADTNTDMMRDPTELGVGASQILPVVVLCLLAKPGDVVMIEQPELHLHPRPQQILGDFLIAVARSGRQVIAETHSDHVVNRIRRRVAEDQGDELRKLARVLFAQRVASDQRGFETRFTSLDVNEFGTFDEWPEGFFDEARDDLAVIARAAAARARALIENSDGPHP